MPRKSGKSRASALSCRLPFLLRNGHRLGAVNVANILGALRRGDILRSRLLAGLDGPLSHTIAFCRGERAHVDRTPRRAPRLGEPKAEFGPADPKYLAFFGRLRNLALHWRALGDDCHVVQSKIL